MDNAAVIRYHGWWPGSGDPYYQYNVPENSARINYYGPDYAPHYRVDGTRDGGSSYGSWGTLMSNAINSPSPLTIDLTGSFDETSRTGTLTVTIFAESTPGDSNLKLRIALTESDIYFVAPNGATMHHQTFRDMIPSASGEPITISQGETVEFTYDFSTPSPLVPRSCELVAFVQSDQTHTIIQGSKVWVNNLGTVSVDDEIDLPEVLALDQNYPNPFNADTKIDFRSQGGQISLDVYDLTGAKVRTLVNGSVEAGNHSVVWDGTNDEGNLISSGVYFYKLSDSERTEVKRMTLLK